VARLRGPMTRNVWRWILALLACAVITPVSESASIDAGLALYTTNCLGCHGMPPNGMKIDNLVAANRPDLIRNQIQINPAMSILSGLTDADLANVATFLANPVSSDADCIFGWGEIALPSLLTPRTFSDKANGFDYRHYPPADVYLGIRTSASDKQRHVYFLDARAGSGIRDLGVIDSYLDAALKTGCP